MNTVNASLKRISRVLNALDSHSKSSTTFLEANEALQHANELLNVAWNSPLTLSAGSIEILQRCIDDATSFTNLAEDVDGSLDQTMRNQMTLVHLARSRYAHAAQLMNEISSTDSHDATSKMEEAWDVLLSDLQKQILKSSHDFSIEDVDWEADIEAASDAWDLDAPELDPLFPHRPGAAEEALQQTAREVVTTTTLDTLAGDAEVRVKPEFATAEPVSGMTDDVNAAIEKSNEWLQWQERQNRIMRQKVVQAEVALRSVQGTIDAVKPEFATAEPVSGMTDDVNAAIEKSNMWLQWQEWRNHIVRENVVQAEVALRSVQRMIDAVKPEFVTAKPVSGMTDDVNAAIEKSNKWLQWKEMRNRIVRENVLQAEAALRSVQKTIDAVKPEFVTAKPVSGMTDDVNAAIEKSNEWLQWQERRNRIVRENVLQAEAALRSVQETIDADKPEFATAEPVSGMTDDVNAAIEKSNKWLQWQERQNRIMRQNVLQAEAALRSVQETIDADKPEFATAEPVSGMTDDVNAAIEKSNMWLQWQEWRNHIVRENVVQAEVALRSVQRMIDAVKPEFVTAKPVSGMTDDVNAAIEKSNKWLQWKEMRNRIVRENVVQAEAALRSVQGTIDAVKPEFVTAKPVSGMTDDVNAAIEKSNEWLQWQERRNRIVRENVVQAEAALRSVQETIDADKPEFATAEPVSGMTDDVNAAIEKSNEWLQWQERQNRIMRQKVVQAEVALRSVQGTIDAVKPEFATAEPVSGMTDDVNAAIEKSNMWLQWQEWRNHIVRENVVQAEVALRSVQRMIDAVKPEFVTAKPVSGMTDDVNAAIEKSNKWLQWKEMRNRIVRENVLQAEAALRSVQKTIDAVKPEFVTAKPVSGMTDDVNAAIEKSNEWLQWQERRNRIVRENVLQAEAALRSVQETIDADKPEFATAEPVSGMTDDVNAAIEKSNEWLKWQERQNRIMRQNVLQAEAALRSVQETIDADKPEFATAEPVSGMTDDVNAAIEKSNMWLQWQEWRNHIVRENVVQAEVALRSVQRMIDAVKPEFVTAKPVSGMTDDVNAAIEKSNKWLQWKEMRNRIVRENVVQAEAALRSVQGTIDAVKPEFVTAKPVSGMTDDVNAAIEKSNEWLQWQERRNRIVRENVVQAEAALRSVQETIDADKPEFAPVTIQREVDTLRQTAKKEWRKHHSPNQQLELMKRVIDSQELKLNSMKLLRNLNATDSRDIMEIQKAVLDGLSNVEEAAQRCMLARKKFKATFIACQHDIKHVKNEIVDAYNSIVHSERTLVDLTTSGGFMSRIDLRAFSATIIGSATAYTTATTAASAAAVTSAIPALMVTPGFSAAALGYAAAAPVAAAAAVTPLGMIGAAVAVASSGFGAYNWLTSGASNQPGFIVPSHISSGDTVRVRLPRTNEPIQRVVDVVVPEGYTSGQFLNLKDIGKSGVPPQSSDRPPTSFVSHFMA